MDSVVRAKMSRRTVTGTRKEQDIGGEWGIGGAWFVSEDHDPGERSSAVAVAFKVASVMDVWVRSSGNDTGWHAGRAGPWRRRIALGQPRYRQEA